MVVADLPSVISAGPPSKGSMMKLLQLRLSRSGAACQLTYFPVNWYFTKVRLMAKMSPGPSIK